VARPELRPHAPRIGSFEIEAVPWLLREEPLDEDASLQHLPALGGGIDVQQYAPQHLLRGALKTSLPVSTR
jgi:hypothetical protein